MSKEKLCFDDYVLVIKGKHKGKIGFYDDDASEKRIVVICSDSYIDSNKVVPYIVVGRDSVIKLSRKYLYDFFKIIRS